jgi:hypothetical protein
MTKNLSSFFAFDELNNIIYKFEKWGNKFYKEMAMNDYGWIQHRMENIEQAKKIIDTAKYNRNTEITNKILSRKDKMNVILKHYGPENQLKKVSEEAMELHAVITGDKAKQLQNLGLYRNELKTEVADVLVMAYQAIRIATDLITENNFTDDEVFEEVDFKINRQLDRIADENRLKV